MVETKGKMLNKDIACRDGQVDDEVAIITYGDLPGTHPILLCVLLYKLIFILELVGGRHFGYIRDDVDD